MLLMVWILFVLIVPRSAVLLAGRAVDVPSVDAAMTEKSHYRRQLWSEDMDRMTEFQPVASGQDMFQEFQVHADIAGVSLEALKAAAVSRIPQGRFLDPEEVAHIAVYLGSSESDGMTGQTITISGGMRMA